VTFIILLVNINLQSSDELQTEYTKTTQDGNRE